MILKASQRAGAKQLALHLLRTDENDHVEVHELRGFAADDVIGALREVYAISRGTKCRQFLFSVSLSPPEEEKVDVATFEKAIRLIEERTGLTGQPRAVVFHEKNGRRHAHCVWSRIRADGLRAVNLSYFKLKLREISRELYIEHGWTMPRGLVNSEERNPLNFTREEWQQAKRVARDPQKLKELFQDCWAISDNLPAFRNALEVRGYTLARGDRRGFVAVDWQGEVYAITRWVGVRAKELEAKLGDPADLLTVDEAKAAFAEKIDKKLARFASDVRAEFETARAGLAEKRRILVDWQRHERQLQAEMQLARSMHEARDRAMRFRPGIRGLWDRVTGRHAAIQKRNAFEAEQAQARDQAQRQALIDRQLEERRELQRLITAQQNRLERDLAAIRENDAPAPQLSPVPDPTNRQVRQKRRRPSLEP